MSTSPEITNENQRCGGLAALLRPAVFLCLSFLYTEIVYKLSIRTSNDYRAFIFVLLFAVCSGLIVTALFSLFPVGMFKVLMPLCLAVVSLVFMIQFFICRFFKMPYDLNTILNGVSGELTTFSDAFENLILCDDGISHIILFLFPLIAWFALREKLTGIFPKKGLIGQKAGKNLLSSTALFAGGAAAYGVILLLVFMCGWSRGVYTYEYSFEAAVSDFGLGEGFCLDAWNMAMSKNAVPVFENADVSIAAALPDEFGISVDAEPSQNEEPKNTQAIAEATETTENSDAPKTPEAPEEPIVYGPSISDIDFETLAAQGGPCADIDAYVASLTPSSENEYTGMFKGKNLILICAEAFSGCIIDPELTPTLYRLSTKGINFNNYYQQSLAGTTGGEYQLLFGLIPSSGGSSIHTITKNGTHTNIGALLDEEGYYGMAFHNSSYTFYGRDKTHTNMGYSAGYMGMGNGLEEFITRQWPESDLELVQATLPMFLEHQPFNTYYMTVSGHSVYLFGNNAMAKENKDTFDTWCEKKGLSYSEPVRAYVACNLELEKALTYLIETLEKEGIADETVICIAPDHFPYGLDTDASLGNMPYLSELYGYNVTTYEERDRNRAIIWCGSLEDDEPIIVDAPTSSLDMLPTLCNLFDVDWDSRLYPGRDVLSDAFPVAFFGNYDWRTDLGYYNASRGKFTSYDENADIPEDYVSQVSALVRNKMTFCKSVLSKDYYTHVYESAAP